VAIGMITNESIYPITSKITTTQEGLSSGVSDKSVTGIMQEVEARLSADGRL